MRTLALQAHTRPITELGAAPLHHSWGQGPDETGMFHTGCPSRPGSTNRRLSEYPTQAIRVESSMDPSCPGTGNFHVSMSLPDGPWGPWHPHGEQSLGSNRGLTDPALNCRDQRFLEQSQGFRGDRAGKAFWARHASHHNPGHGLATAWADECKGTCSGRL